MPAPVSPTSEPEAAFVPFNPTINPKEAFAWDLHEIYDYLEDVENNPTKHCSNPAYNKLVTDGDGPHAESRIHVVAAAEFILDCAFAKEPHIFNANLPGIGIEFEGCALPDNTVFDVLGWLLSVCSEPPVNATDRNYYLPLLALFARWCRLLGGDIENAPTMVHIAWFKGPSGKELVFLGSTIGAIDTPLRQAAVERERQSEMVALKFKPVDGQLVNCKQIICRKGTIVNQKFELLPNENKKEWVKSGAGYGICAETFFYLIARHLTKSVINEKTVKGFALRPRLIGKNKDDSMKESKFQKLDDYDEAAAAEVLAAPCERSCQRLIPQLGTLDEEPPWTWQNIFDVSKLQEEITPGSSRSANVPVTPAGGSSGAAAVKKSTSAAATKPANAAGAKGKAKPSFKGGK